MPYESLRDFILKLEDSGRLVRVAAPVDPHLEMTEIQTRLLAEGGPAVMFENPVSKATGKRYRMPMLVNLFGTVERVAWGMDREPSGLRALGETLGFPEAAGTARRLQGSLGDAAAAEDGARHEAETGRLCAGAGRGPDRRPDRPQRIADPGLLAGRAGAAHHLAAGRDQGPGKGKSDDFNLGIYRMQVLGKNQTLMRWLKHRGGAQHHARWGAAKREPFPAAVVIGADPGTILAAVTPVPDTMSEYHFAGMLRGKKVELVDCKTVPLQVPAHAEIVLEGHVSLEDYRDEGPYGDHTGYYNSVEPFPVFTISAITMRARPDLSLDLHRPAAG